MNELEQELDALRAKIHRGKVVEELELNSGWKYVREQAELMMEALRHKMAKGDFLHDHEGYVAAAGAHNALASLFGILDGQKRIGLDAQKRLKENEDGLPY